MSSHHHLGATAPAAVAVILNGRMCEGIRAPHFKLLHFKLPGRSPAPPTIHLGGAKRGAARQRWPRRIPLFGAVSAIHSLMAPGRSPTPPTTEKALAASQRWPRRSSRGSSFFGAVSATHSLKITWAVLYTADISGTETWRGETRRRPPRVGRSCLHVLARHPFGAVWANHSLAVTWAVLCTAPCQRWPQKIATTKHVMT